MLMSELGEVTELLVAARAGERGSLDRLFEQIHQELHARHFCFRHCTGLRRRRHGDTPGGAERVGYERSPHS